MNSPRPPSPPVLEVENLSVSFATRATRRGDARVIRDLSLSIAPGEAVGLVGESGCGKSTLALAVMQDLGPGRLTGGAIRLNGHDLAGLSPSDLRRVRGREVAMVYQEPMAALNPMMRIGAQLAEVPRTHQRLGRAAALARARQMIVDVRLPDPDRIMAAYPHQLSGGQQQRAVIAMALMADPALLILDEPTTALDATVAAGIIALIRDLARRHGTALLFISHDLPLVLGVCDRLSVMYGGQLVETGAAATLQTGPRHPYTRALFAAIPGPGADKSSHPLRAIPGTPFEPAAPPPGCGFAPRCDHARPGLCDSAPVPMQALPGAGHSARCLRLSDIATTPAEPPIAPPAPQHTPSRAPTAAPVLTVTDLRKYHPVRPNGPFSAPAMVKANDRLSFAAQAGEILAIVGESGCGKSTLARLIAGLDVATAGRINLFGRDVQAQPLGQRPTDLVAAVQMVFQNPAETLNPAIPVGRQILRALDLFGIGVEGAGRQARMLDLLDLVQLPRAVATRRPHQLSGGQKQRAAIARALAGNPRMVVADEPVSALDLSVQAAITGLLLDLQRRDHSTLLYISHDLATVRYLADRVMVMYLGHVVEIGTVDQVFAPPFHPYTARLLSAQPGAATDNPADYPADVAPPSAINPPPGCPFQTRCAWKSRVPDNRCDREMPPPQILPGGHRIACHLAAGDLAQTGQGAGPAPLDPPP